MAGEKRTVLVREISYLGTDGEDHIAHLGDEITVHKDGVEHFDWVQDATPEAAAARDAEAVAAAEKASRAKPAPAAAAKKDDAAS